MLLFQETLLSWQWTTVTSSPSSPSETQNSLTRIFAISSRDNETLFQTATSKMIPKPSSLSTDGRWVHWWQSENTCSLSVFRVIAWNNALELISPIWCVYVYVTSFILLYYCSIMNNGCVTCRSQVCLRAGSISLCRLCLNVNPEPMSLLWTGWIGPTNTTLNQQKTPDWWGQKWPSLSTGWRYSTVCRETHC